MEQIIVKHPDASTTLLVSKGRTSSVTKAEQAVTLLGADTVAITVKTAAPITFYLGDQIEIYGKVYTLNQLPTIKKTGARKFEYDLTFEGVQYELIDAQWLLPADTVLDSFTGDLEDFIDILIGNINRVFPGKWVKGVFPEDTEYKTLTFIGSNCLEVAQNLCSEYGIEFEIAQEAGIRTLNFKTAGVNFPYTFRYGRTGGLYELTRQNINSKNVVTRLYLYGGSNNLGSGYRYTKLCLSGKGKNASYIENAAAIAAFGLKENTKTFDDIYPNRYGVVSSLGSKYYAFVDNTMNFDLNEKESNGTTTKWLISGVNAKVKMTSGNLAGYEFEIHKYNHATKEIQVVPFTDENGYKFPSETSAAFQFGVGDKYIFTDINLPDAYKEEAEAKLQEEGETYYNQYCQPQVQYALSIDQNFIKQFGGNLTIVNLFGVGDYIQVEDADLGVNKSIRITAFTRDLLQPYKYSITLGDTVTKTVITRVIEDLQKIDTVIEINDLADPSKARRNWRAAQEVLANVFDPDGNYYSEKIRPLSIETTMLSVGARSQQFTLQNIRFEPNYNGNANNLQVSAGILIHYTIEETIRSWNINTGSFVFADNTARYIYARAERTGTSCSIVIDTAQRTVDSDAMYYYFLVGTLSSIITDSDGSNPARLLSPTYGASTINGRFIRTGRIQSSGGGTTYFDLDAGEIGGNIVFKSTSGANKTLATAINEVETTATNANNAATTASENAATAKQLAENIQVGSRNYIRNISSRSVWTVSEDGIWYQGDIDSDGWHYPLCQHQGISLTKGDYIITVWLLDTTATSSNGIGVMTPARTSDSVPAIIGSFGLGSKFCTAGRYTFKFTLSEDSIIGVKVKNRGRYKIKLEQGNVSTDWTIAPEDVAATVINNLQVGGRNIVLNSSRPVKLRFGDNTPTPWTMAAGFANTTFAADSTLSAWVSYYVDDWNESYPPVSGINLGGKKGESHTWGWAGWTEDEKMIQLTPTTRRYYFKVPTANRILVRVWLYSEYTDAAHTPAVLPTIYNVMASFGHVLTDWEPAPEDVDYLKTAINQGTTEIDGGLVLSNIMAVKDINGNITAGMNGLSNGGQAIGNDCRIWAGATADDINGAPFRVYDNGHVELQDVNINSVDSQGNTAAIENGSFLIKASNKSVKTRISQENISGFDASAGSITATINSFESGSIAFISHSGAKEYTGSNEVTLLSYTATKTCYIDIPDIRLYAAVKTAENAVYPSLWTLANIDVRVSSSYLSISGACSAHHFPPSFGNNSNNKTISAKRCNLAAGESVIIKASYSFMMTTNYPDAIKEQPQLCSVSMSVTPASSVVNGQYGAYANNLSSNGFVFSSESGKMMGYINNAAQDAEYFRMQQQDFTLRGTAQTLQFRRTPTAPFVDAFPLAMAVKLTFNSSYNNYTIQSLYNPYNVSIGASRNATGTIKVTHELGTANIWATGCGIGTDQGCYIWVESVSTTEIVVKTNLDHGQRDKSFILMLWKY